MPGVGWYDIKMSLFLLDIPHPGEWGGLVHGKYKEKARAHTTLSYLCLLFLDLEYPQPIPEPNMHQSHQFPLSKLLCKSQVFPEHSS